MKKKELILKRPQDFKMHKTSDPKVLLYKYLVKPLRRKWMEDFIDEDTGDVVPIERSEIVADVGQITQNELQQITFHLQAGDIQEVEYCCHDLGNTHFINAGRTYYVEFIQNYEEHKRCLVFAKGVEQAMQIIADYLSVNFGYNWSLEAVSIKTIYATFIPDNHECIPANEQEELTDQKDYYKVNVKYVGMDGDYTTDYIITSEDVGMAKSRVERFIEIREKEIGKKLHYNIRKAMPFDCDFVVPVEYCKMYWDEKE